MARAGLDDFMALLGTPPPVTIGSYNKHVASLSKTVHEVGLYCEFLFPCLSKVRIKNILFTNLFECMNM